jgi:hypothetical protein
VPHLHWNYDGGLYAAEAIRIQRAHCQQTKGIRFRKSPKLVVATGAANPFKKGSGAWQRTETVLAFLADGERLESEIRRLPGIRSSTVNTLYSRSVIRLKDVTGRLGAMKDAGAKAARTRARGAAARRAWETRRLASAQLEGRPRC